MAQTERGFTLTELMVIIAVIGLLTWVALPRNYLVDTSLGAAAHQIQSDIRYTQELAMTRGKRHQIRFYSSTYPSPTNRYEIRTSSGQPVTNPLTGDGSYVVDFNAGTFPGVRLDSTLTLEFDSLGRPDAAKTISLNGGAKVITVTVETGLVSF